MKTLILSTCLASSLQLLLGSGCGVSIHPDGDDDIDRPDGGDIDGGATDGGAPADGNIADGGAPDADLGGGADAGLADASPEGDASPDAGAQDHPVQVQAGASHSCALAANGTVRCWGDNTWGQLGQSTTIPRLTTPTEVPGLAGVSQMALGAQHTCALMSDSTVRCWGVNNVGQTGTGSPSDFLASPTAVTGLSGVLQLAAGHDHTCARLADGSARCWGRNSEMQLGDGTDTDRPRPTHVPDVAGVTDIALGTSHTCMVDTSGAPRCWGGNQAGQVIPGGYDQEPYPVAPLFGVGRATSVALGYYHTCARMTDGTAKCWGSNENGQLGGGRPDSEHELAQVTGMTTAVEIDCGANHSCARLENGVVSCWGSNSAGQLGDGTLQEGAVPGPIGNITDAIGITAGAEHSCAIEAGGALVCWGNNAFGQLGDGTTTLRLVPTPALW
jgi:alpha-tubulin suppressor-like RCC1 family protein